MLVWIGRWGPSRKSLWVPEHLRHQKGCCQTCRPEGERWQRVRLIAGTQGGYAAGMLVVYHLEPVPWA